MWCSAGERISNFVDHRLLFRSPADAGTTAPASERLLQASSVLMRQTAGTAEAWSSTSRKNPEVSDRLIAEP